MRSDSGWVRWRPSPAMAVSLLALFVALSGTAMALQRNSVGPRHIKGNAVRSKHIKNRQVTNRDIRSLKWGKLTGVPAGFADGIDNTGSGGGTASNLVCSGCVQATDLGTASVVGAKLAGNAVTSPKIANGQVRAADLGPVSTVESDITVGGGGFSYGFANCPPGTIAINGGFETSLTVMNVHSSGPSQDRGWFVAARNPTSNDARLTIYASCLAA